MNPLHIYLDGGVRSSLDWKGILATISPNSEIVCHLNLGLFSGLTRGLTNGMDFQALLLSLRHFRDAVWTPFQDQITRMILFEGSLDMSVNFPWDATQEGNFAKSLNAQAPTPQLLRAYCLDAASEYIGLLVQSLPDGIPLELCLDASSIQDPFEKVLLLNPERFPRLKLHVTGAGQALIGDVKAAIALCLPATSTMAPAVVHLEKKCIPYKLIPESELITSWDQLDILLYDSGLLSPQGQRKLLGFTAAGGLTLDVATQMAQITELKLP